MDESNDAYMVNAFDEVKGSGPATKCIEALQLGKGDKIQFVAQMTRYDKLVTINGGQPVLDSKGQQLQYNDVTLKVKKIELLQKSLAKPPNSQMKPISDLSVFGG